MKTYKYFIENSLWRDLHNSSSIYLDSSHYSEVNSLTYICSLAFGKCEHLVNVSLPNVTSIGQRAFFGTGVTSANLPKVQNIQYQAFGDCRSLSLVHTPVLKSIDSYAFYYCMSLRNIDLNSVISLGSAAFYCCEKLQSAIMPLITSLPNQCFYECMSLSEFNCGNLRHIGSSAFYRCSALKSLDFTNVSYIGTSAFNYCVFSEMSSLHLENCTYIGSLAFNHVQSAWSEIYITEKCSYIGSYAFASNLNLRSVYIMPDSSMTSQRISLGGLLFSNNVPQSIIFCDPFNSMISYYKTAPKWSSYSNIMFYSYSDPWGEDSSIETY